MYETLSILYVFTHQGCLFLICFFLCVVPVESCGDRTAVISVAVHYDIGGMEYPEKLP